MSKANDAKGPPWYLSPHTVAVPGQPGGALGAMGNRPTHASFDA